MKFRPITFDSKEKDKNVQEEQIEENSMMNMLKQSGKRLKVLRTK